ncbi:MAG TPA: serine/threonine-protein kinase [Lachnospiraceae bacterium]|nr:serine/threonine-protein kinase [Lachnospiraceae bacterium]
MDKIGGRYQVLQELGTGATAQVLLVWDEVLHRKLAVKKSKLKELLVQEGRVLASLSASLFPHLYDYREEQEFGYLFIEYVQGENLKMRAVRIGRFTVQEVLHIGLQIAEALHLLHVGPKVYVYGDIKPENVIMQDNGTIKLIDFGAACDLQEGNQIRGGTKFYAPPEMWNQKPDIRNDIYSLGIMLKFLFLYGERTQDELDDAIVRMIERCIQKNVLYRYQSMEQLINQLKVLVEEYRLR